MNLYVFLKIVTASPMAGTKVMTTTLNSNNTATELNNVNIRDMKNEELERELGTKVMTTFLRLPVLSLNQGPLQWLRTQVAKWQIIICERGSHRVRKVNVKSGYINTIVGIIKMKRWLIVGGNEIDILKHLSGLLISFLLIFLEVPEIDMNYNDSSHKLCAWIY